MKRLHIVAAILILLVAGAACADPVTLYTKQQLPQSFKLSSEVWTNPSDETVSWSAYNDGNAIAYFRHNGASASSFTLNNPSDPFRAYGLVVDYSSTWIYFDMRGNKPLEIGAGGVDVKRSRFYFGHDAGTELHLTADQTWTGSGTSSDARYFSVGGISGDNCYTKLVANEGVTRLDITGKLHASLYAPNNQLGDVTVTVADSAKLWLLDLADARLNAKELVMSGDGVHMAFGSTIPEKGWYYPTASAFYPTNIVAIDNFHLAPAVELANGADISARGGIYAISNLVVSGTAQSVISGDLLFTQAVSRITFANEGASLAFTTTNRVADGFATGFAVDGPGTLTVNDIAPFTGDIALSNGAVYEYGATGSGTDVLSVGLSGDGTFKVNSAGTLYIPSAKIASFTGTFEVDAGTLVLDSELAEGRVVVNGGTVSYASSDPFVVTDVVRPEASITVASNETLKVYGNGLTAATALTLTGGTVKFCSAATVASPITVTRPSSRLSTDAASVTGTVSGVITSSIPGSNETPGLQMRGPGCIRLTGGGTFSGKANPFRSYNGSAIFDGGTWTFSNCMYLGCEYTAQKNTNPDSTCGKRWTVRNGAVLKVSGSSSAYVTVLYAKGHAHNATYAYESFLDVVDGGTVELDGYSGINAGYYQARGTLRVGNGGVVKVKSANSYIMLGNSAAAWGVLRLEDGGRIELSAPIRRKFYSTAKYQPQGQFIWDGGTLKVNSNFPAGESTLFKLNGTAPSADPEVAKGLRVWTKITGENCVLDLTDLPDRETPLANVAVDNDRAEWFGTGTLTVKGGKTFTMNSFGSGLGLALEGDGTKVVFPDAAQFHDNAICVARQNVEPGPPRYSVFTNLLADASFKAFTSKGFGVKVVSENATNTLTVAEAVAAAGGEFANDTISFPGGLEVTNLTFAAESVIGGNGAFPTLHVEGDIVLPSSLLYYSAVSGGMMSYTAFTAGGSVGSTPSTLTKATPHSLRPTFNQTEKSIDFSLVGGLILIR